MALAVERRAQYRKLTSRRVISIATLETKDKNRTRR